MARAATGKRAVKTVKATEVAVVEPQTMEATHQVETASIEGFIGQAIQVGLPVESMERLFVLREKVKAEQAREAFTKAMADFQAECPVIVKDKHIYDKNNRYRYSYAPLDSIVTQVKEALGRNHLSYSVDTKNGVGMLTAICKITHVLGHSEVSSFEVPIDQDSYMSAPQKYASASTFAKRYAFLNALGILTGDEDTDAADLEGGATAPAAAPAAKAPLAAENPVMSVYKKQLQEAKDIEELGTVWANLPAQAKKALESVKDEMKAIITSAA